MNDSIAIALKLRASVGWGAGTGPRFPIELVIEGVRYDHWFALSPKDSSSNLSRDGVLSTLTLMLARNQNL